MTTSAKVVEALLAYDSAVYADRVARSISTRPAESSYTLQYLDPVPGRSNDFEALHIILAHCEIVRKEAFEELRRVINEIPLP